MDLDVAATHLVEYACKAELIEPDDRIWAFNAILERMGVPGAQPHFDAVESTYFDRAAFDLRETLSVLIDASREMGNGDNMLNEELVAQIMGVLTPRPSVVTKRFNEIFEDDPMAACSYLYALSCDVDYVKRAAIARDIKWQSTTAWGVLDITINLSKPEKDPRAIARAARSIARTRYPACQLCIENEGYAGRSSTSPLGSHPARQNLRIVPIELVGEQWGLQYSPYAYFDEHCIVMSREHRPMHVDKTCFERLIEFVSRFEGYFIGSNADLPIVGGSILSHDHFQGGKHTFAMMKAPVEKRFEIAGFPNVSCGVVKWPVTVLRLCSADRHAIVRAGSHILDEWRRYSDKSVDVIAQTDDAAHNTITPIARKDGDDFVLDLALRCNITSEERPFGVFHPREELHHIKKENIGLIEVMGMAILPPRLRDELTMLEKQLVNDGNITGYPEIAMHSEWANQIRARHPELDERNAEQIIKDEVAQVFVHVLEDVGVFKWDAPGRNALNRFLSVL